MNCFATRSRFELVLIGAIGSSISIVCRGHEVGDVLPRLLRRDRLALVGQEHVALAGQEGVGRVAARAVLRDDVLEQLLHERAAPACRVLPSWRAAAYAASTFHFAEPELNGFGVTIWTPGLTRSFQRPDVLRVAAAEGEDDDGVGLVPVVGLALPALVDEAGVDERVHVEAGGRGRRRRPSGRRRRRGPGRRTARRRW